MSVQSGRGAAVALARIHNGEEFLIHTIRASATRLVTSLYPNLAVRQGAAGYIDQEGILHVEVSRCAQQPLLVSHHKDKVPSSVSEPPPSWTRLLLPSIFRRSGDKRDRGPSRAEKKPPNGSDKDNGDSNGGDEQRKVALSEHARQSLREREEVPFYWGN